MPRESHDSVVEIALMGDLGEHETEITEKLLSVPIGGECTLYFDSPGGSAYCAVSLMSVIVLRNLNATGIVTGECSSAALWPLAVCRRRIVTPYSILLFHPMRWQSEENVQLAEAAEWARHFAVLEKEMERSLAAYFGVSCELMESWIKPGRYLSGREFAAAGLAELVELQPGAALALPMQGAGKARSSGRSKIAAPRAAKSVS
jgi:ATP-dependent Clp protease, protease subunit